MNNSVTRLTLESSRGASYERDKTCVASCLAPLVKGIRSLFDKWGHQDHIMSLKELLLIEVDFNVNDLIDLIGIFQQIRLTHLELQNNNIVKNDTAKLLKAVKHCPLQTLKISSNQMEETVALIEPFLPTLKRLTLHDVQVLQTQEFSYSKQEHTTEGVWETLYKTITRNVVSTTTEHQGKNPDYECKQYLPLEELVVSENDLSQKLDMLPLILQCMPKVRLLNLQNTNLEIDDIRQLHTILVNSLQTPDIMPCLQLGLALIVVYVIFSFLFYVCNSTEAFHILAWMQLLCWFILFYVLSPTFLSNQEYCKHQLQMQDLDLSKNYRLGADNREWDWEQHNWEERESHMSWLIDTIKCMPNLQVLNLHGTHLGANDMISLRQALTYGIPFLANHIFDCQVFLPLKELDLSGNMFHGGINHLTKVLKCLPQLKYLTLGHPYSYQNLDGDDVKQLSLGLNNMPNLETLDLSGSDIGDSMVDLSQAISSHTNLHVLRLYRTNTKCEYILTFNFEHPYCFSDSCLLTCAYVEDLPNHLLCSRCSSRSSHLEDDSTVSRHQSTNIDKPRFEFQTDIGPITVFNQGIDDRFLCRTEEQIEYVNCLVTDNHTALDLCRKLSKSLNITLN